MTALPRAHRDLATLVRRAWIILSCALLLIAAPGASQAQEPPGTVKAEEALGRVISDVKVEGVPWANNLRSLIRGAVRVHDPLTRTGLQRAVRLLQASSNAGRRLSRISAIAEPGENNIAEPGENNTVRVRFEVEPLRKVSQVGFQRPPILDANMLLRAANLPVGSEFWPDSMADCARRIALAYYSAGWREAQVGWEARPDPKTGDVGIFFEILEGVPTTLVQLEFEGDKGLTDAELHAAFDLRSGSRLSMDVIEEGLADLRARYRNRQFFKAKVGRPRIEAADQRAVLIVPVNAGPRFHLQVRGNRSLPESLLLSKIRYTGEDPLEPTTERELAERMRAYYVSAGFPDARVFVRDSIIRPSSIVNADGDRSEHRLVTFLVHEGQPIRVIDMTFEGLRFFPLEEMVRRVHVVLEDAAPPELVNGYDLSRESRETYGPATQPGLWQIIPNEVFSETAYETACEQLTKLYKAAGFLDARVGPAQLDRFKEDRARVVIPIVEGPRTFVKTIAIVKKRDLDHTTSDTDDEDADYLPDTEVAAVIHPFLRTGDPVSFLQIEDARTAIGLLYKSQGHLFVEVEDREEDVEGDANANGMNVTFVVKAGKAVHVSTIDIRGTARTDQTLVREALALKDGDLITPLALQQSVRNLLRLGIFTAAAVDISEPDRAETPKVLVVHLREKPAYSFELKGGASLVDGPRLAAQFLRSNILGRNLSLALTAKVNYPIFRYSGLFVAQGCDECNKPPPDPIERYLSLAFGWPIYRGGDQPPIDQRFDFVHENKNRPAYSLRRWASGVSFDGFWRAHVGPFELSAVFQSDVENDLFKKTAGGSSSTTTFADRRALQLLPEGEISLLSLRPGLNIDSRDDKLNPTKGFFANISLDFARSFLGPEDKKVQLVRGLTIINGYIPVYRPRRIMIALGGRIGAILPSDARVIGTKRFFLGGTSSLRGFNEDALVPEDQRKVLHQAIDRCQALVSRLGCGVTEGGKPLDTDLQEILSGTGTSLGGVFMLATRSEIRFALTESLDGGVFLDAGNLWADLANVDLTALRYAAGFGVRFPLPIGPAAFDAGFNLKPDSLLNEPSFRIHLSIGAF